MEMLVTCVGVLVFDMFAVDLPRISPPGKVTFAPQGIEMDVGGHSANVSLNLRRLGLKEGEVSSVGALGQDVLGAFIEEKLKDQGVVTHLQRVLQVGTSKDLVLVVKGEDRRYHVEVGANLHLSPDYVLSVFFEEKPSIFYVGGTGMLGEFDDRLADVLQETRKSTCLTLIDPSSPLKGGWDFLNRALRWTDIIHCNDDEAFDMTGERDPRRVAEILRKKGANLVIISRGERGLIAKTERFTLEMPAFNVKAIDPSGAGDAFCAGVIYKLTRISSRPVQVSALSVEEICDVLIEGAATGAACVTGVGTTAAVTRQNVDRLLERQKQRILEKTSISTI